MKYLPLIWAALRRKPARSLLTCFSIATAFFLFGTLQGINVGIEKITKLTSVSHLIVMSRVSPGLTPMPLAHESQIRSVPGVTAVAPFDVLVGTYQRPNNPMIVIGTDLDAMIRISADMMVSPQDAAAMRRTRNGVIVGVTTLRQYGWKVGDQIPLHALNTVRTDGTSDWHFTIVGSYTLQQPDWATRIFANYDFINEAVTTGKNQAIDFYVGISDPARSSAIAQAIDDRFANSPDQTATANEKDYLESTLAQIGNISFLVNGVVAAVMFTLLFLTSNTIAQSVRERTSELAVLKTLGFTDSGVQWLVLTEALVLGLLSAAIGVALASRVLPWMTSGPALSSQGIGAMHVPGLVYAAGAGVATLLALVSGVPPALRARRLNIVAALSGR
ncbi:MAG TPA: FtsX-like permease family protein [Steroidobacteraceae bacterium]|nr:FtsX-like permease family protein [Steroidobacteraceae bacterium]